MADKPKKYRMRGWFFQPLLQLIYQLGVAFMAQIDELKQAVADIGAEVSEVNAAIDKVIALLSQPNPDVDQAIADLKAAKIGFDEAEAKADAV